VLVDVLLFSYMDGKQAEPHTFGFTFVGGPIFVDVVNIEDGSIAKVYSFCPGEIAWGYLNREKQTVRIRSAEPDLRIWGPVKTYSASVQ
jgi:hypothetical protein